MSTNQISQKADTAQKAALPRVLIATTAMLAFVSFWRAAAIVLNDMGSSAFYAGAIAEHFVGKTGPWFILAIMCLAYAVRSLYIESCSMFVRGGVYRVVKEAMGGTLAKFSVSALMFDYILTGPISGVSAGLYLVGLLNEYFTAMVGIVIQEDGVVDKYIGDAIMAVFGAPVPKPEDPVRAVRAAIRMRRALAELNVRLEARSLPKLRTGIGIHTGTVVAGNIGSEQRMEYTVIGDAVNLASRLETSTKDLGVDVLISESTYERTKHVVVARPVREITVKGRERSVLAYEVLRLRD